MNKSFLLIFVWLTISAYYGYGFCYLHELRRISFNHYQPIKDVDTFDNKSEFYKDNATRIGLLIAKIDYLSLGEHQRKCCEIHDKSFQDCFQKLSNMREELSSIKRDSCCSDLKTVLAFFSKKLNEFEKNPHADIFSDYKIRCINKDGHKCLSVDLVESKL